MRKKMTFKDKKKLQELYAWSQFYTDRSGGIKDSKGEDINRIRYRTDLLEKYRNIQEEIAEMSAKFE